MNKKLTTIETNTKIARNRTKSLLSLKNKLITKDKKTDLVDDSWMERLWEWADENGISDFHFINELFEEDDWEEYCDSFISRLGDCYDIPRYIEYAHEDINNYIIQGGTSGLQRNDKLLLKVDKLYLRKCKLKYLPKELSKLKSLKELNFQDNSLEEIPKELCELTNLEILHLGKNKLNKLPKELSKLVNLKELHLQGNSLEEIPKEVFELTNLEVLDLGNNKLKKLPNGLSKLKNLRVLILRHNNLEEFPDELLKLKKINILFLRHNQFDSLTEIQYEFYNSIEINHGFDITPIESDLRDDEYNIENAKPFKIIFSDKNIPEMDINEDKIPF